MRAIKGCGRARARRMYDFRPPPAAATGRKSTLGKPERARSRKRRYAGKRGISTVRRVPRSRKGSLCGPSRDVDVLAHAECMISPAPSRRDRAKVYTREARTGEIPEAAAMRANAGFIVGFVPRAKRFRALATWDRRLRLHGCPMDEKPLPVPFDDPRPEPRPFPFPFPFPTLHPLDR
jgi:hypothetical protein